MTSTYLIFRKKRTRVKTQRFGEINYSVNKNKVNASKKSVPVIDYYSDESILSITSDLEEEDVAIKKYKKS